MDQIINDEIPHVAERIFKKLDIDTLVHCLQVSKTWHDLASSILSNRWQEVHVNKKTILIIACKFGYTDMAKAILDQSGVERDEFNVKGHHPKNGFWYACENGHLEVVKLLLKFSVSRGIPITPKEEIIKSASHHREILKLLFNHWSIKDVRGPHLFSWAVQHKSIDIVQLMLDHLDRNSINYYLMRACVYGHFEIVELFLKHANSHNIDLNAKDITGKTAFSLACERANVQIIQCFLDNAIVRNLDINARDNDGRTALRNVCRFQVNLSDGHREIVKLLLKLPNIEVPRKGDESKFAPEIQSLLEEKWESMENVEVVFFNDTFSDVREVKKEVRNRMKWRRR